MKYERKCEIKERKKSCEERRELGLVWFGLVWFYGISIIIGYLMPNPF